MRTLSTLPLVLAVSSIALLAQQTASTGGALPATPNAVGQTCPVDLTVKQGSGGGLLAAHGRAPSGMEQNLHLTLHNPDPREIAAFDFEVTALSPRARVQGVAGTRPGEIVRHFHLDSRVGQLESTDSDLSVSGATAVLRIALTTVTYVDGGTWHAGGCSLSPDPFMLVASR